VIRGGAVLLLLVLRAAAAPSLALLDGRVVEGARLVLADGVTARVETPAGEWRLPLRNLASLLEREASAEVPPGPRNLYLHGGDELRGTVRGEGMSLAFAGPGLSGLRVPLDRVRAVRYGRLLGAAQATYDEIFLRLLDAGANSVVVQRDAKPFPIDARVVEAHENRLRVRIGASEHDLPDPQKVYGFVLAEERDPPPPPEQVLARIDLVDGGRITLPFEGADAASVRAGGAVVERARIARIRFLGGHVAELADLDPIETSGKAALGEAPPFRKRAMVHGGPLQLGGRKYESGLGVHAYSRLAYPLGRRWRRFHVVCGVDDAAGPRGEALFRVSGDGKTLAEARLRRGDPPVRFVLDVSGVDRLALEAEPLDAYVSDFCDWADARLFNAETMEDPPGGR
jgi:hypothetical protein